MWGVQSKACYSLRLQAVSYLVHRLRANFCPAGSRFGLNNNASFLVSRGNTMCFWCQQVFVVKTLQLSSPITTPNSSFRL